MTDKELLEMAAKAAGIEWAPATTERGIELEPLFGLWLLLHDEPYEGQRRRWNPLTDDGDAFRLAVKLNLEVKPYFYFNDRCQLSACAAKDGGGILEDVVAYFPDTQKGKELRHDPCSATRRAIVLAAAEIEKGKL